MYNVRHFHTTLHLLKMMLVVPHAIGAIPLFIYKKLMLFHMRNLRHPI